MREEPEVMEYESVEDLEDTIEEIYEHVEILDEEMDILLEQVGDFLNYRHDMDEFKSSADYVSSHIPAVSFPSLAKKHAHRELENPKEAENYDKLLEAEEIAEPLHDQWETAYTNLWDMFGYSDEKLADEVDGHDALEHFLWKWENKPYQLFEGEEKFTGVMEKTEMGKDNPGFTMTRQFAISEPTPKQVYDEARGKTLANQTKEVDPYDHLENRPEDLRDVVIAEKINDRWIDEEALGHEPDHTGQKFQQ